MTIGEELKALRKAKRISIEELADRSRVSDSTISKIERGIVDPHVSTLLAIFAGLNVSIKIVDLDKRI